jgi:murein DD-endopeptidase MepM/ murein hydrolase activator NlpD
MDLTENNITLTQVIYSSTEKFSEWVNGQLHKNNYRYGVGGYDENRAIYAASSHFDDEEEPRRLHLGLDIWGPAGTPIYAFMGGTVHSFAYNGAEGDYGATLVLLHQLDGIPFYTLYGHISKRDIQNLSPGNYFVRGQEIAHFGERDENGNWPPHLHLQLIMDMELKQGDYPGVCKLSEREKWLVNCPDPDLVANMMAFAEKVES